MSLLAADCLAERFRQRTLILTGFVTAIAGVIVLRASKYKNHGERVVAGQRLMQAVSDIFLGAPRWTSSGTSTWGQAW